LRILKIVSLVILKNISYVEIEREPLIKPATSPTVRVNRGVMIT